MLWGRALGLEDVVTTFRTDGTHRDGGELGAPDRMVERLMPRVVDDPDGRCSFPMDIFTKSEFRHG